MSYPQRVAAKATQIEWARVLLSAVSAPFYVLGYLLGLLLAAVTFAAAAIALGVSDARTRGEVTDAR